MTTRTLTDKLIATTIALCGCLWIGGSVARLLTGYDIFVAGTPDLKTMDTALQLNTIHISIIIARMCTGAYMLMIAATVAALIRAGGGIKARGYAFMAAMLVLLALPAEAYLLHFDRAHIFYDFFGSSTALTQSDIQSWFLPRMTKLSPLALLSLLAHLTAAGIMAWRPLDKSGSAS